MTGFGQGAAERGGVRVQVELKGVNHRFLDVKMRLPVELGLVEPVLRSRVQEHVSRARIDIAVTILSSRPSAQVMINRALVTEYLKAVDNLKKDTGLKGTVGLDMALSLPGVVAIQADAGRTDGLATGLLEEALGQALDAYDAMRLEEGGRLADDLATRLNTIEAATGRIEHEAGGLAEAYARKVRERVGLLLDGARAPDESRLAQEIAFLVSRADITEELVRLKGYAVQAKDTITRAQGPIGKTLDFIMQEMNREANTISSKAESLPICQEAIRIKGEVEKIREQAQNLE